MLLALCVVTSGCATHAASTEPNDPADIRTQAVEFYQGWAGTPSDRRDAEVVAEYRQNGRYSECMTRRGYDLSWQAWTDTPEPVDPLGSNVWLADPNGPDFAGKLQAQGATARADLANEDAPLSADGIADGDACRKQAGAGPTDAELQQLREPSVVASLKTDWTAALDASTAEYGTVDDFVQCLARAELPGKPAGSDDIDAFTMKLSNTAPEMDVIPAPGAESTSPGWAEYQRMADDFVAADWACRDDVYPEAMTAVPAVIDAFERDHADEIAQANGHWAAVHAEADRIQETSAQ